MTTTFALQPGATPFEVPLRATHTSYGQGMWESDAPEYSMIKSAELALFSSNARSDETQLSSLLSVDFAEIGRSGRRWTYPDTVAALQGKEPGCSPETSEWLFNRVSAELVLVNYRIHEVDYDSRHASLWEVEGPVLRFHQGTVISTD